MELVMPPKDTLPWVTGKKFYEVPPQPLVMTNERQSKDWYAVYKGFWVGVVTSSWVRLQSTVDISHILHCRNTANTATTGASGGSQKAFKSQQAAVQAFNEALEDNAIAVVSK